MVRQFVPLDTDGSYLASVVGWLPAAEPDVLKLIVVLLS